MTTNGPQSDPSTPPIFGLTKAQLQPIVENIAAEAVASFDITVEHHVPPEHYGGRGEKVVPTFTYETRSGRTGRTTVFVKQHCNPGPNEALHYQWLTTHSAPVPRIYGAVSGPDVHDIIFIEHLDPFVGDEESFLNDVESFPQFLAATARFNAIQPHPQYAAELPSKLSHMGFEEWHPMLSRVWAHAAKGDLGEELRGLCSQPALQSAVGLADDLPKSLAEMQAGLSHWDHRPNNIGRRRDSGEMVIFDLEDTMLAPRFEDVADWLALPNDLQPRCRPREHLVHHYLDERARHGGSPVEPSDFEREIQLLWKAHVLRGLDWWLGYGGVLEDCDVPPDKHPNQWRERNRQAFHRELSSLLLDHYTSREIST